jgi:hypothetical protein
LEMLIKLKMDERIILFWQYIIIKFSPMFMLKLELCM